MAAKGINTAYRYSFARKPLITNDEIRMIEKSTNRNIGDMTDGEISGHVQNIRQPAMSNRPFSPKSIVQPIQDKKKVDYLEPFRSPEDKSDIGKQMIEHKIADIISDADRYMTDNKIDFEAKKRIMDHYVNPLAEKFRKGHISERDFKIEVDSKVRHNTDMNRTDGLGAFSWAKEQPKKQPDSEIGPLNFIDKAKAEAGIPIKPEAAEDVTMMARDYTRRSLSAKSGVNK
jgi:hypothetical protein